MKKEGLMMISNSHGSFTKLEQVKNLLMKFWIEVAILVTFIWALSS